MGLVEPREEVLLAFWTAAREKIGLTSIEYIVGSRQYSAVCPPAVQLSDDPAEATELALAIAAGELNELTIEAGEGDELPQRQDRCIVCDGDGLPRALIETTGVNTSEDGRLVTESFTTIYPR